MKEDRPDKEPGGAHAPNLCTAAVCGISLYEELYSPTSRPPLEAPLTAMRLATVYFSWIRYSAAHWKSSKQFCLFPSVPPAITAHGPLLRCSGGRGRVCHICTFVPGEAVLSAPPDVGHGQDSSQVPHKQQVSNADDSKARKKITCVRL